MLDELFVIIEQSVCRCFVLLLGSFVELCFITVSESTNLSDFDMEFRFSLIVHKYTKRYMVFWLGFPWKLILCRDLWFP